MNLKIAAIQSNLFWESPQNNLNSFSKKIEKLDEVDLIILPEMFSTGFSMDAANLSESMNGNAVNWMKNEAIKSNAAITGSLIIKEQDQYFNRMIFMYPDGSCEYYDKRHLFRMANEHKVYTSGKSRKLIRFKDWTICLNVCYDLRFPVWSRNTEEFDLLLYVANWPDKRVSHWSSLLKARAIENLCYVIGVNRVGTDGNGHYYSGHSTMLEPSGKLISELIDEEGVLFTELSIQTLVRYREKFGFLNDKDRFTIEL